MNLADLVSGRNQQVLCKPATAKVANLANLEPISTEIKPTLATLATLAIATPEKVVNFEATSEPVSCRFWQQVCYAVGFYQESCTRSTDCPIYKFLALNCGGDK